MPLAICGLGTASPRFYASQVDTAAIALEICHGEGREAKLLSGMYARTGIKRRHSVLLDSSTNGTSARQSFFPSVEPHSNALGPATSERMQRYKSDALPLASEAAREALRAAKCPPEGITDLVTISCSGFSAPGLEVGLIDQLDLSPGVSRTHIGFMGCHGAINGLRVANALAQARGQGRVLMCAVELCSLHHQYGNSRESVVSNSLFADGAAAIVGEFTNLPDAPASVGSAMHASAFGSTILPGSQDLTKWEIGDHGFQMSLSPLVPQLIGKHLEPWLIGWLASNDLTLSEVQSWSIHPGGPKILTACQQALKLDDEDVEPSWRVLQDFGNMSSPTVLFILQALRKAGAQLPCVMLAFGPGLVIEAALIK